jgi:hypothetical protein
MMPTSEDFAYLAGMIDGEGTITLHRHRQHKRIDWQYRPRVLVVNTHRGVLDSLGQRFGGKVTIQTRHEFNKTLFMWRIIAMDDIHRVLTGCLPYLIVKRERAVLMLEFAAERISRRIGPCRAEKYTEVEPRIHAQIKILNATTRAKVAA